METAGLSVRATNNSDVLIVGGGISGLWCAVKLARNGIKTGLITYTQRDRGGIQGATVRSVGAINTSPLTSPDFHAFMRELGDGQENPDVAALMLEYVAEEIEEIKKFAEYRPIALGVAIKGRTQDLVDALVADFVGHGGQFVDGWVTRIVMDAGGCRGIQYQSGRQVGKWLCHRLVIASGGYAGLFGHGIQNPAYGTSLGQYLKAGGGAVNLEFVFKHGYGRPDVSQLTPTEGLPGAEIYDQDRNHAEWLERELYYGRGTANHLQAFRYWRRNHNRQYYIDLSYRRLWELVNELRKVHAGGGSGVQEDGRGAGLIESIRALSFEGQGDEVAVLLNTWMDDPDGVSFERFKQLKAHIVPDPDAEVSKVRQLAYFSMGGIYHQYFETNLKNVYVTGEVMHDFGSHRVGGLPWGLYLVAGRIIAERITDAVNDGDVPRGRDFELKPMFAAFDPQLLEEIRERMYLYQEDSFDIDHARQCVEWFRTRRRALAEQGGEIDDGVYWLLVAEGIMVSSIMRRESRGCFFRADFPVSSDDYVERYSYAYYDPDSDEIQVRQLARGELFAAGRTMAEGAYENVVS